jgi:hypothetical protein
MTEGLAGMHTINAWQTKKERIDTGKSEFLEHFF